MRVSDMAKKRSKNAFTCSSLLSSTELRVKPGARSPGRREAEEAVDWRDIFTRLTSAIVFQRMRFSTFETHCICHIFTTLFSTTVFVRFLHYNVFHITSLLLSTNVPSYIIQIQIELEIRFSKPVSMGSIRLTVCQ